MPPKIHYIRDDNTDRDFPDAIECQDAEFKLNGEYLCVEPCGGGGKHLLGDQYIHVETWGSDSYVEEGEEARTGTADDPFKTIERALVYISTIVTISGMLFVIIGDGTFYITNPIFINHPNRIEFVGKDFQRDRIVFYDEVICNIIGFYFGGTGFFTGFSHVQTGIESIEISILSNTAFFGDMAIYRSNVGACSNGVYGIMSGNQFVLEDLEYFAMSIQSNAALFGYLTLARQATTATSDGIIGLISAGGFEPNLTDTIDYITFANLSDATDFGDLAVVNRNMGALSDGVNSITCSGYPDYVDDIGYNGRTLNEYVVFNIKANATIYSETIPYEAIGMGACSSKTTGMCGGGVTGSYLNHISYITFATKSNNIEFGDLTVTRSWNGSCSNGTNALWAGGDPLRIDIDYVIIDIQANATVFGEITTGQRGNVGLSGN